MPNKDVIISLNEENDTYINENKLKDNKFRPLPNNCIICICYISTMFMGIISIPATYDYYGNSSKTFIISIILFILLIIFNICVIILLIMNKYENQN